jgi:hypothetical protein
MPAPYTRAVAMRAIEAAMLLLTKVGCDVQESRTDETYVWSITPPVDSSDPHGDRYLAVLDAQTA